MRVVIVTGTSTDVGKTIVTAALASRAARAGSVVVVKPVQTGIGDGSAGDVDVVTSLTGCPVEEWVRLDEPLAPDTAARRQGVVIPVVAEHAARVVALARSGDHDTLLVEGAGGLLVRLDADGGTLLDLARLVTDGLPDGAVEVVVVTSAGLGTLNHTELTVDTLRARGLEPAGLVIGSWPVDPGLAETCNLHDLPRVTGLPLLGVVPAGAGSLSRAAFAAQADRCMTTRMSGDSRA
ncbi:ATP-dependent dethiobiotin synthetase BioD [Nocardioides psychrotolerans]|uniref:ATP-dependent dethiobiotin synthetase BioD n=1 Tax=Nocardioides psychrotolerans TaxID=1005945 RepID=A0A1I3CR49_9ACTN|nr:dethiobiotin synthase [Nocardioides psychrotolerans]GEP36870.1 ATP-dependent dethiobiotin synthetase BioD [Nocardioides psychrotolerans]SFH76984.1 8-amino-7-oxononanoate synthase/dethiobiotin synthetase [Nocardioides psychrotolerans]